MELTITAKNLSLTDEIERYARKRLAKLDRHLRESVPVRLVLRHESTSDANHRYIAEVTADLKGGFLRGEERAVTASAAIDLVTDVLDRQAKRYRTRHRQHHAPLGEIEAQIARQIAEISPEPETEAASVRSEVLEDGRMVRVKHHPVNPMTVEEATSLMELVGHDFFVFQNTATTDINVVYRRRDGDYGLIVPDRTAP